MARQISNTFQVTNTSGSAAINVDSDGQNVISNFWMRRLEVNGKLKYQMVS